MDQQRKLISCTAHPNRMQSSCTEPILTFAFSSNMLIRFLLGNIAFLLVLLSVCEYLKDAAGQRTLWQASLVTMRRLVAGYIIDIAAQRWNEAEGLT
jgi:hypothetical protein